LYNREKPNPVDWSGFEVQRSDVVIAVMGLNPLIEGEEGDAIDSEHSGDRTDIGLPSSQVQYLKKISETKTPIILVLVGGSPIAIGEIQELASAIIFVWYSGEEGGNAIGDILFGDAVPSGKLPVTFPGSVADLPAFDDYRMAGRTYRYLTKKPLYPFGFGLGYTKLKYELIKTDRKTIRRGEKMTVEINVRNAGDYPAHEAVQLYVRHVSAGVPVPNCELKDFIKIRLMPGEKKVVKFTINDDMLKIVDQNGNRIFEPGECRIIIGGCSPGDWTELGASEQVEASLFKI
jgi:beta-glucosidase